MIHNTDRGGERKIQKFETLPNRYFAQTAITYGRNHPLLSLVKVIRTIFIRSVRKILSGNWKMGDVCYGILSCAFRKNGTGMWCWKFQPWHCCSNG